MPEESSVTFISGPTSIVAAARRVESSNASQSFQAIGSQSPYS